MFSKAFLTIAILFLPHTVSMEYEFGRVLQRKKVRSPTIQNFNVDQDDDWRREESWRSLQEQSLSYWIPEDRDDWFSFSYSYSMSYSYTPSPMPSVTKISTTKPSASPSMAPTQEDVSVISQILQNFPRLSNFVETCVMSQTNEESDESEYTFQIALHLLITANNNSTSIFEGFWQFVFPLLAEMILECRSNGMPGIIAMDIQDMSLVENVMEGNLVFFSNQAVSSVVMRMIRSIVQMVIQNILESDVELSWISGVSSENDGASDTELVVTETSTVEDVPSGVTGANAESTKSSSSKNKAMTWIGSLLGVMGCVLVAGVWKMKKTSDSDMDTSSDASVMEEL